ncbi:hypothetical protein FOZ62_014009, partial [Perkinsus olseni]
SSNGVKCQSSRAVADMTLKMERGIVRKERVGATSVNHKARGTEGWRPYGAISRIVLVEIGWSVISAATVSGKERCGSVGRDVVIAREAEVVGDEETRSLCT